MGSTGNAPIVHYDYEFSPYGQKTKILLQAAGVPYERVNVSPVLPRQELESLGITYRRIPVLSVGKDVYCDSSLIFDIVLNELAKGKLPTSKSDKAWETWGYSAFSDALTLAPVQLLTPDFVKDRSTIFPILGRSDYESLRPSGIADLQSRLDFLENDVLGGDKYIGGDKLSVSDIHAIWGVRWALYDMESQPPGLGASKEPGVGKSEFPKVWELIENLPVPEGKTISGEEAKKKIEGASYTSKVEGILKDDPTGLQAGTKVTVDSLDSSPHSHPQAGKLVALSRKEIVIELENQVRLHFPREGYILREAK